MARYDSPWLSNPSTLAEVLMARSEHQGNDLAYGISGQAAIGDQCVSYGRLDDVARRVATALTAANASGIPVLLHLDTNLDFVSALFGCLYARAIAVPLYPLDSLRRDQTLMRMVGIVRDSGAKIGLVSARLVSDLQNAAREHEALRRVQWIDLTSAIQDTEGRWPKDRQSSSDIAVVQYTSGSTRAPRGVTLSHSNILSNLRMMQQRHAYSPAYTFVSWLPLAHDWGLVGNVLLPMWCGCQALLMTPRSFLERPVSWLEAISRYSNVTSGAPSFAYDYCVRRISPEERKELDLSMWCRAGVGAGRVSPNVLERFAEVFGPAGFRREVFYNGYGLAEATLSVSATAPSAAPTVLRVDRAALEAHDVRVSSRDSVPSIRLVGSGEPNQGSSIRIVDPSSGARCAAGRVGEIWVSGPNVSSGYWNGPAERHGPFAVDGGIVYVQTGDLGFIYENELFVAGRLKDVIVVRGRNVYPEDVEWAVEGCHDALRPGGTAAFEFAAELAVVQEVSREVDAKAGADIVGAVRRAVVKANGIVVRSIILVPARGVPKTSSGKTRRSACRNAYIDGTLDVLLEDTIDGEGTSGDGVRPGDLMAATELELLRVWRRVLGSEALGGSDNFVESGGDSLKAYECQAEVAQAFGIEIPLEWFMSDNATIAEMARLLDGGGARRIEQV